ncbi:aldehyde dehydrogenase [Aspergillus eucalypticola CBS 122712]|uniref:Beta-apo-4'-carotenal oxygenase n=1 Tax=Aspergillus eucalypticola (strain CBS 122712 / IBT 29274) TaxID=1448314 RepID=A0A317W5V0_ASPEC|nr:aldehyde dehydrogenase [Aspergillus eucalypticola CBS 122712]PWY81011.1 aldehyde dehydrogenase [Aspergillus eucalypticola CBS 122712]
MAGLRNLQSMRHAFTWNMLIAYAIIATSVFSYGFDDAAYSTIQTMDSFEKQFGTYDSSTGEYGFSTQHLAFLNSLGLLTKAAGTFIGWAIGEYYGRRTCFIGMQLMCIIGISVSYSATTFGQILAGRMIVQCFIGWEDWLVPMFLGEICPTVVRGATVVVYVFAHMFGSFICAIITYETSKLEGNAAWKIPIGVMWTFPCFILLCSWLVPESPRWLVRKNKIQAATKQLEYLNKGKDVDVAGEVAFLQAAVEANAQTKGSWAELLQGTNRRRTMIAVMTAAFNQLTGQSFVSQYGSLFVKSLKVMNPFAFTLGSRGISTMGPLVTFSLVDTTGRRPIYLIGGTMTTALLMACGGLGTGTITDGKKRGVCGVLMMYGLFYIMSFGSISVITGAETPHLRLRDKTSVVAWLIRIVCDFAVSYSLPYLLKAPYADLQSKVGFIYGSLAAVGVACGYFFLPELTGRSLEELEDMWQRRIPARKFSDWESSRIGSIGAKVTEMEGETEDAEKATGGLSQAYASVRAAFASGRTKSKDWRRHQLKRAWWMVEDNKDRMLDALRADLNKHPLEAMLGEITGLQNDILRTLDKLDEWTKDEKPTRWDPINFLGGTVVRQEPLGVSLIIGAWNFPFILALQPLVAAIAAGCAVILKPSDVAQASQDLLMEIVPMYMDRDAITCVSAGPSEMKYILESRFDHIFYTGSANVARIIYAAAAKHLTPVTLELGGQGPAIVAPSANIDLAAKHIAWAKFSNAGQICINVNHVLIDPSIREAFVTRLIHYFDEFTGGRDNKPDYYSRIINERNFDRLESLLDKTSGKVIHGGIRDRQNRYFGPTIVVDVSLDDPLLSEELFGPILPIIDADLDTAISFTRSNEHPLALYAFTNIESENKRIQNETSSGGVTFNDCLLHAAALDAPFGGVGHSGIGSYHGKYGILAFSHLRTYTNAIPTWMEGAMGARYPPYSEENIRKLSPPVKAPFDREGNDTTSRSKVLSAAATLAVLGISVWMFGAREKLPPYGRNWLRK